VTASPRALFSTAARQFLFAQFEADVAVQDVDGHAIAVPNQGDRPTLSCHWRDVPD
jgi:hypothetical protein